MFRRSSDDLEMRPMSARDVDPVLDIIAEHDSDDGEEAAESFQRSRAGQFVLEKGGRIVGTTGAKPIPGTDRSFGVSWTYLQRGFIGRGYGHFLLDGLLDYLRQQNARKAFINSSDYYDPEDGDVYRDAHEAYRAAGFQEEMRHLHYYDQGESLLTFGLRLQPRAESVIPMNESQIRLTDIDEIPECDGAFWLAWELSDEGTDPSGFQKIFDQVAQWDGRVIFMAFPSDVARAGDFAISGRFRADGRLLDYYEDGVDEVHYRHDLLSD